MRKEKKGGGRGAAFRGGKKKRIRERISHEGIAIGGKKKRRVGQKGGSPQGRGGSTGLRTVSKKGKRSLNHKREHESTGSGKGGKQGSQAALRVRSWRKKGVKGGENVHGKSG